MRRAVRLLVAIALAVLLASGVAEAITYGQPDGNRHPYVGALVVSAEEGEFPLEGEFILCSVFMRYTLALMRPQIGRPTLCERSKCA